MIRIEDCDECAGRGDHRCPECGTNIDCEACDGTGEIEIEEPDPKGPDVPDDDENDKEILV